MSASGELIATFESTDLAGNPLWDPQPGPRQLAWWPGRDEVLADNGPEGRVYRFNLRGEYLGELVVPTLDQHRPESLGFAFLGGRPVAATSISRAYYMDVEPPELVFEAGDGFDDAIALATGHEDTVVALMRRGGSEWRAYRYDARARPRGEPTFLRHETRYLVPFLDGHLSVDLNGLLHLGPDLAPRGRGGQAWDGESWDEIAPIDIGARGGITWLD